MKDLIILGNGMAGMTAALYAKRANLDFKIVGKDEYDFGQIGNAILVENYPCAANQSGFDLAMSLHGQLEANSVKIEEYEVKNIVKMPDGNFRIEYCDGYTEWARSIIYATGARHRQLDCEIQEDVKLHYCALCDGTLYKDKYVAIIGGGDVAFTQAEYLSKICTEVWIVMCDRNVTAAPSTFERVSKIDNIKIIYDYPIECIRKYEDGKYRLKRVYARDFGLPTEGIFVAIGMIPNIEPIKNLEGIKITSMGVIADESGNTGVEGFFVAGDVRFKSVRQALTAASDGAYAINSVIAYLARRETNENS